MIINSDISEEEALMNVAKLMIIAARTAPKALGEDSIKTAILNGREKDDLADVMEEIGRETGEMNFIRDAKNVKNSGALVLIGVESGEAIGSKLPFKFKLIDLGIAIGSAVKIASDLNVDNRIMYNAGQAALKSGLLKADEIEGIPLSISGKNIFFDRK